MTIWGVVVVNLAVLVISAAIGAAVTFLLKYRALRARMLEVVTLAETRSTEAIQMIERAQAMMRQIAGLSTTSAPGLQFDNKTQLTAFIDSLIAIQTKMPAGCGVRVTVHEGRAQ